MLCASSIFFSSSHPCQPLRPAQLARPSPEITLGAPWIAPGSAGRTVRAACPAATAVPEQTIGPDTVMDAHNRTVSVSDFTVRDWNGFVSAISSEYQQADAARGDNRVFALGRGNAVLVVTLGTLRLGGESRMNWAPVVSSIVEPILTRVGGGSAPPSPGG